MRIFLYELKKLFGLRAVAFAAALGFTVLFFARPFAELEFIKRDCWQADAIKIYGVNLSPSERERAETELINYYYEKMDEYIARTPALKEVGIMNHEDAFFFEEVTVPLSECIDDPEAVQIYFGEADFTGKYGVTQADIRPLTQAEYAVRWEYFSRTQGETATLNLLMQKIDEFYYDMEGYDSADKESNVAKGYFSQKNDRKILESDTVYNLSDSSWSRDICRVIGYVAAIALGCVFILIMPVATKENLCGTAALQYSSKCGRKICRIRFAAMLMAAFAVMAVFTVVCVLGIKEHIPSELWQCCLNGFESFRWDHSVRYWFSGTLLEYAVLLAVLAYALAAATVVLVYFLSHTSANYISLLLKAVPCIAAVCFAAFALINGTLVYNGSDGYELISITRYIQIPYINIAVIAFLAAGSFFFFSRFYRKIKTADVI